MTVAFSGRFASKKDVVPLETKPAEPPLAATVEDSLSEGPVRLFNHLLHYIVLCILLLLPLHVTRIRQIQKLAETFLLFSETIYKIESVVASPFHTISLSLNPILLTLDQQPSPVFDPPNLDASLLGCCFDDEPTPSPTEPQPAPSSPSPSLSFPATRLTPSPITISSPTLSPPHPIPNIIINPPEESDPDSESESDSFSLLSLDLDFDEIEEDLGSNWSPTPRQTPSATTATAGITSEEPELKSAKVGEQEAKMGLKREGAERRVELTTEGMKGGLGRWGKGLFRGRQKRRTI